MSFTITTYLKSNFDYVVFSSCILAWREIRDNILADIDYLNYKIMGFTLICSRKTLEESHYGQGLSYDPSYDYLDNSPYPGDIVIDTDKKTIEQVKGEIRGYISN